LLTQNAQHLVQGQQRAAFLAAGGLWRLSSAAGREASRAQASAVAETQRRVDAMSEQELDALVATMLKVAVWLRVVGQGQGEGMQ
jgi:hypothetical protein